MMMIAPDSLVHQKKEAQWEEETKWEVKQKLPHQARTLQQVHLGQECRMRGTEKNMDSGVGQKGQSGLGIIPILSR